MLTITYAIKNVVQGWVQYANKSSNIVNIDETNVDVEHASEIAITRGGGRTIGCTINGSSERYTALLGITMDEENLPPFILSGGGMHYTVYLIRFNKLILRNKI
jgi:hypothetical protein